MTRPSHALPRHIFEAILELEDRVRAATANPDLAQVDPAGYIRLEIAVGQARDALAQLILDEGVTK